MSPNLAKVNYTWTQADTNRGFAIVHINWRSQMNANYVAVWSINDLDAAILGDYWQGDMHNITPSGMDVAVYSYGPGDGNAGDKLVINAVAFEWNQGA